MITAEVTGGGVLVQVGRRSRPHVQREELRSPIRSVDDDVFGRRRTRADESAGGSFARSDRCDHIHVGWDA